MSLSLATKFPILLSGKIGLATLQQVIALANPYLTSEFILRIQTDGTLTPRAALMQACQELINDLGILSREFTKEWELRKMVGDGAKADEKNGEKDKNAGR